MNKGKGKVAPLKPSQVVKARKQAAKLKRSPLKSPYLEQIMKQFLLPGEAGDNLQVSPATYPQQVCVRHLHKKYDISSANFPNGFTAVMRPDLFMPGFVSSQFAQFVPAAGVGGVSGKGLVQGAAPGGGVAEGLIALKESNGNQVLAGLVPIMDGAGTTFQAVACTATLAAATVTFIFSRRSESPCVLNVYAKTAVGNWVALGGGSNVALPGHAPVTLILPLPVGSVAIGFNCAGNADVFSADFSIASFTIQYSVIAQEVLLPAFETFVIDNDVVAGRVISMSILAQNTSPEIANGGNINIGRVPYDFNPFGGDAVDELSGLPDNRRYQGPASKGAYCSWMPSQSDEFEPDFISAISRSLSTAEYIYLEVDGWGGGALTSSYRLNFDWIVEFYTPNQIFEKVLTPPRSPQFDDLYHLMLSMPAATCNPEHEETWSDFWKRWLNNAKSAGQFYADNAETIDAAALAMIAMLA